ncbi:MAG: energy transducer TonB [Opitutaceae bacterium]|nr:energy transducer TonB [Opitutaceae bacterium]
MKQRFSLSRRSGPLLAERGCDAGSGAGVCGASLEVLAGSGWVSQRETPEARKASSVTLPGQHQQNRGFWMTYGVPAAVAAAVHVALALGGGRAPSTPAPLAEAQETVMTVSLQEEIEPLENEVELTELSADQAIPPVAGFVPPQLIDVSSVIIEGRFVQALQPSRPQAVTANLFSVPSGAASSGQVASNVLRVFALAAVDEAPQIVTKVNPLYPRDLKRARVQGEVVLGFVVSPSGEVQQLEVLSSTHPGFERAALASIARWRFEPGLVHGTPVATRMEQAISFTLGR